MKKWVSIGIHVLVWLAVFLFPYLFNPEYEPKHRVRAEFRDLNTITKIFWLGLFYFNAFVMVPRMVYKRKYLSYVLCLLGIFSGIMLVHGILFTLLIEGRRFHLPISAAFNFFPFAFTVILSTAYQSITDQIRTERMLAERQNENLKTELAFLRSQISPHFLFNVMNNIVALVRMKSEELEPTVMKLSGLMQYMLYESDEEKVLLKSEVEYIRSYMDLQKQRFGPELGLEATFDVVEEWHAIEPMLLIPFVENAFKHGNGALLQPDISIYLSVRNNTLHFVVKNKFEERDGPKDKTSGIGLINVRRRLELLYPHRHRLTVEKKKDLFTVDLQLTLS